MRLAVRGGVLARSCGWATSPSLRPCHERRSARDFRTEPTAGSTAARKRVPMRIVVNGQQAFGAAVLEALLERGEDVVAVYCAPDKEGRPPDPLAEAARKAGIELRQPHSFETETAAAEMAELRPELMVMAFVTLFIPEPVLHTPTHGS